MKVNKKYTEADQISILREKITEGIESGRAENFDPKKHLQELKSNKRFSF